MPCLPSFKCDGKFSELIMKVRGSVLYMYKVNSKVIVILDLTPTVFIVVMDGFRSWLFLYLCVLICS